MGNNSKTTATLQTQAGNLEHTASLHGQANQWVGEFFPSNSVGLNLFPGSLTLLGESPSGVLTDNVSSKRQGPVNMLSFRDFPELLSCLLPEF